jgi:hypothetical protein
MVVVEEEATRDAPEPRVTPNTPARKPGAPWSSAAQMRRSLPMLRLLADIWAIPQVGKVGLLSDDAGIQLRVLVRDDDRAARAKIYDAEREYLNATATHGFALRVTPMAKVGREMPPLFETVLER